MHGYREKMKMAEDDRGQFLGNCALELTETAWVGYYHLYASPHETGLKWMHGYGENAKMAEGDGG